MDLSWFILAILASGCLGVKTSIKEWQHSFEDDIYELEESLSGCTRTCLSDLFEKANELRTYKNPRAKFSQLCSIYKNASSCIANEEFCPHGDLFMLALEGMDELCIKRRKELEPFIPCLEKNTKNFLKNCDKSCGLSSSVDVFMKSPYVFDIIGTKDLRYVHKELDQVCNTTACMTSCLARELNKECGKPSGSILVGALLKPLDSISSTFEKLGRFTNFNAFMEIPPMCRNFIEKRTGRKSSMEPARSNGKREEHSLLNGVADEFESKHMGKGARTERAASQSHEAYVKASISRQKKNSQEKREKTHIVRSGTHSHKSHERSEINSKPVILSKVLRSSEEHRNRQEQSNNSAPKTTIPTPRKKPSSYGSRERPTPRMLNSYESRERLRRVHPRQVSQVLPLASQLGETNLSSTSLKIYKKRQTEAITSSKPNHNFSGSREISDRQPTTSQNPLNMPTSRPATNGKGSTSIEAVPVLQPAPPPRPAPQPTPQSVPVRTSGSPIQFVQLIENRNSHESKESREDLHQIRPRQANQPPPITIWRVPAQSRYVGHPRESRESGEQNHFQRPNESRPPTHQPLPPLILPQPPRRQNPNSGSSASREWQGSNRLRQTQRPLPRPTSRPPPPPPTRPTSPPRPPNPHAITAPPRPASPPRSSPPPPPPAPPQPQPRSSQPSVKLHGPNERYRWRRIRSVESGERYRWRLHRQRQTRDSHSEGRYRWRRSRQNTTENSADAYEHKRYRWRRGR